MNSLNSFNSKIPNWEAQESPCRLCENKFEILVSFDFTENLLEFINNSLLFRYESDTLIVEFFMVYITSNFI